MFWKYIEAEAKENLLGPIYGSWLGGGITQRYYFIKFILEH